MGTPGGDAAEFLLGLNAIEQTRSLREAFTEDQVFAYFQDYLSTREYFYMHTDIDSLKAWREAACVTDPLHPKSEDERQKSLRVANAFIGCEHLQAIYKHDALYYCRHLLTDYVLKAIYRVFTDPTDPLAQKIRYVVLNDTVDPKHEVIVNVFSPTGMPTSQDPLGHPDCMFKTPLLVPNIHHYAEALPVHVGPTVNGIRFYHARAVYEHRARFAEYLMRKERQDEAWRNQIFKLMNEIGQKQLLLTKEKILESGETMTSFIASFELSTPKTTKGHVRQNPEDINIP